jgi:FlaA1/EpsC-like NDP-sugar epimerase
VGAQGGAAAVLLGLNALRIVGSNPLPRSVIIIDGLLQVLVYGMMRATPRWYREVLRPALSRQPRLRTLIYGDGGEGVDILKALQASGREFEVIGFVTTSPRHFGRIGGVPVHRPSAGWRQLVERLQAESVLVPSTVPGRTVRQIRSDCIGLNVNVHVIPAVEDITGGRCSLAARDVSVTELLRREPARLEADGIRHYLAGRRVLVTGAAGSIGSELCRALLAYEPAALVMVDQSELGIFTVEQEFRERADVATALCPVICDITKKRWLRAVLAEHRPHVVFHAAAYKHVPLMEKNVQAAVRNNVLGTKVVADLARAAGVERFVQVSTDKAVRPASVMGATKFLAERYIQAAAQNSRTRFITVRFGNVLNSTGSVIPTFRRQIATGGPVTVTHPEMRRFFMTIPEASQLVLQAGALGDSGDVFILEMGEPVRIVDLAMDMIRLSGRRYPDDVDIIFTGTRPGEKLNEELFYDSEDGAAKVHDKIVRAHRGRVDARELNADLRRLTSTLAGSPERTSRALWQIVARHVEQSERRQRSSLAA